MRVMKQRIASRSHGRLLQVAAPWGLSHYIALNGFHPLYRALVDHAPDDIRMILGQRLPIRGFGKKSPTTV